MQSRQFPLAQQPSSPRRLSKARPLTPETPWTTASRPFTNELFSVCMPVIVKNYKISITHPNVSLIQTDRCMCDFRRFPATIWIALTKICDSQLALATRFDLIEQLNLIRRRAICQHKNPQRTLTCFTLMNRCDKPTHASTT